MALAAVPLTVELRHDGADFALELSRAAEAVRAGSPAMRLAVRRVLESFLEDDGIALVYGQTLRALISAL